MVPLASTVRISFFSGVPKLDGWMDVGSADSKDVWIIITGENGFGGWFGWGSAELDHPGQLKPTMGNPNQIKCSIQMAWKQMITRKL